MTKAELKALKQGDDVLVGSWIYTVKEINGNNISVYHGGTYNYKELKVYRLPKDNKPDKDFDAWLDMLWAEDDRCFSK